MLYCLIATRDVRCRATPVDAARFSAHRGVAGDDAPRAARRHTVILLRQPNAAPGDICCARVERAFDAYVLITIFERCCAHICNNAE